MRLKNAKVSIRLIAAVTCLAFLASCATAPHTVRGPEYGPTASIMREARSANVPVEKRAGDYLQAAAITEPLLATGIGTPACETYNAACGELTVLLRSSEGGQLWNHPLTLTGNNNTYHLRLEPATSGVWAPNYFTTFEDPDQIKEKLIRKENIQEGVGGALVGVRIVNPPEKFMPAKGITAPVTATLDFHATDATLALRRPARQPMASVEGKTRPLAANFSAPVNYYQPPGNLLLIGLMAGLRSARYIDKTGLYFLQPYDPDRIPACSRARPFLNRVQLGANDQWTSSRPGNPQTLSILGLRLSDREPHPLFRIAIARRARRGRQTLSGSSPVRCSRPQYGRDAYTHAANYGHKGDVGESSGRNREKHFQRKFQR